MWILFNKSVTGIAKNQKNDVEVTYNDSIFHSNNTILDVTICILLKVLKEILPIYIQESLPVENTEGITLREIVPQNDGVFDRLNERVNKEINEQTNVNNKNLLKIIILLINYPFVKETYIIPYIDIIINIVKKYNFLYNIILGFLDRKTKKYQYIKDLIQNLLEYIYISKPIPLNAYTNIGFDSLQTKFIDSIQTMFVYPSVK
jgi:hypothetical protein